MTTAALHIAVEPFDGDHPEMVGLHRVHRDQVALPAGVFLVAWLDGEAVGCGAVRRLLGGAAQSDP